MFITLIIRLIRPLLLCGGLLLSISALFPGAAAAAEAPGVLLEELHYQVDVMMWKDAVRGKVSFSRVQPGRYRAEISGEAQGLMRLLSGQWQGGFATEMILHQGRLLPVTYREEGKRWGKKLLKEYRFDYDKKLLELYAWKEGQGFVKKWEAPLEQPVYDALTLFYNQRLQLNGPVKGGETLKFQGIPYPQPDEITIAIGATTAEGRKAMVSLANRVYENERSTVFVFFDADDVPTQGYTRVLEFGKISWELLPDSKRLPEKPAEFKAAPPLSTMAGKSPPPQTSKAQVFPRQ